jgi:hypothetical protein
MWVRTPIASEAISSTIPRHEVRAGTPAIANVSRSALPAPASHASGRRRASATGDSSRTAGRRTHRQTRSSASAITIVSGSHQRLCVSP